MAGRSLRKLIEYLQSNKRLMGTCPKCGRDFRLADAVLFSIKDEPPESARAAIQVAKDHIKERREELTIRKERMTRRAQKTAEAVNLGKIVEKIVPSFPGFGYTPG